MKVQKVQTPSFPLWSHASLFFLVLAGLSARAANTVSDYVWSNSSGGSLTWDTGSNWGTPTTPDGGTVTSGDYPSQTQTGPTGTNYDDAFILGTTNDVFNSGTGAVTTSGSFTNATVISTTGGETLNWLDVSLGNVAGKPLTLDINGTLTTTNVNVVSTNETTDQFAGGASVLTVNVESGATFSTGTVGSTDGFIFTGASGSTFTIDSGGDGELGGAQQ